MTSTGLYTIRTKPSERGSALWFILVVLVLIGVLTAFLNRSGSSVEQSGDVEQQRIKIGQMLRYTKGLEDAVSTMILNGVSASDLNFSPTNADSANCTQNRCKVFHVEGGGISYQAPPSGISGTTNAQWLVTATNDALGIGTTAPDLILMLRNINASYCTQINSLLGVTQGAADAAIDFTAFAGTYTATQTLDNINAWPSGCLLYDTENVFYQVLVAR
jgi:hypothetical protein